MRTEVEGLALGLLTMALSRSPVPPLPHPEDASVDEDIGVSALKAKGCCVQWQLPMPISTGCSRPDSSCQNEQEVAVDRP